MKYNKRMVKRNNKEGFTLIELSLSITFIAVLSLAVVLIITNSISAYHRGIVLNQINTVGMELVDEIRATVQNAPVVSLESMCEGLFDGEGRVDCKDGGGGKLVLGQRFANVKIDPTKDETQPDVPVYGVFCTGSYSFIWNSGYFYSDEGNKVVGGGGRVSPVSLVYKIPTSTSTLTKEGFRLLKVKDEKREVCATFNSSDDSSNNYKIDISGNSVLTEEPTEVLSENGNLALYNLYAPVPATNATNDNLYYSISFILGTLQGGANIMKSGDFCAAPNDENTSGIENFDYCAINKFNFAAEAIGGK